MLEQAFQPQATQTLLRSRPHLVVSYALFEYLVDDCSLNSGTVVFEQHLYRLEPAAQAAGSVNGGNRPQRVTNCAVPRASSSAAESRRGSFFSLGLPIRRRSTLPAPSLWPCAKMFLDPLGRDGSLLFRLR